MSAYRRRELPPEPILAGRSVTGPVSARITIDGRPYVNFFGAGYLALSELPQIRAAVTEALRQNVPFARHLPAIHGARDPIFDAVERAGARACGTETSVYFASGYLVGMVAMAGFEESFDLLLLDENAHHSLRDAAKLYGRPFYTFAHCNVESLRDALKNHLQARQKPLVLTDGVFATTGRVPPLSDYAEQLSAYDGRVLVDESHALGVVGDNGRGAAEFCNIEHVATSAGTLSKAYCAQGAIMGCTAAAAARARGVSPLAASSAGSTLSAVVSTASLNHVSENPHIRSDLRQLADYLRVCLRKIGLDVIESPAPIVSFQYGDRADMQALQRRAFEQGIYIHHCNYLGAHADGTIRCAVFRDHTVEDISELIRALR